MTSVFVGDQGPNRSQSRALLLWVSLVLAFVIVGHDAMMTSASADHASPFVGEAHGGHNSPSGHQPEAGGVPAPDDESNCGVLRESLVPSSTLILPAISLLTNLVTSAGVLFHRSEAEPTYPEPTQPPEVRRALLQIYIV